MNIQPTNSARRILAAMVKDTSGSIDASEFADEIVELLKLGLIRLGGTLQDATLEVTQAGLDFIASLVSK